MPVEGEAGAGYVMRPGFDVPPLMFTREETAALVAGARLVQAWGGAALARSATEALAKIFGVVPEEIARVADRTAIYAFRGPGPDGVPAAGWTCSTRLSATRPV